MTDRIAVFDTTLRDGEQSPGCSMNAGEKLRLARQLARLGVDVIEAGFPIASKGEWESVYSIAAEVRGCTVAALSRAKEADILATVEALKGAADPRVHIFLATSAIH
jgi:2-isopropylmalate synthase